MTICSSFFEGLFLWVSQDNECKSGFDVPVSEPV